MEKLDSSFEGDDDTTDSNGIIVGRLFDPLFDIIKLLGLGESDKNNNDK